MLFLKKNLISEKKAVVLNQSLQYFSCCFYMLVLENVDNLARLWLIVKSHIIFLESAEPCLLLFISLS